MHTMSDTTRERSAQRIEQPAAPAEGKQSLRATMRERRKTLPEEERIALSLAAQTHLLCSQEWQKASSVALYMAAHGEIDAGALLSEAWAGGKQVLLPLCSADRRGHMDLVPCEGLHAMRPGPYGILEPDPARLSGATADAERTVGPPSAFLSPDLIVIL